MKIECLILLIGIKGIDNQSIALAKNLGFEFFEYERLILASLDGAVQRCPIWIWAGRCICYEAREMMPEIQLGDHFRKMNF